MTLGVGAAGRGIRARSCPEPRAGIRRGEGTKGGIDSHQDHWRRRLTAAHGNPHGAVQAAAASGAAAETSEAQRRRSNTSGTDWLRKANPSVRQGTIRAEITRQRIRHTYSFGHLMYRFYSVLKRLIGDSETTGGSMWGLGCALSAREQIHAGQWSPPWSPWSPWTGSDRRCGQTTKGAARPSIRLEDSALWLILTAQYSQFNK